ncbi:MAG: mechanosensitive ion channel [Ectothiorhodospiraceae bacterium]|nr:mechanosensitive ion channel [Ectothiorhodospiraceae bacterium]
MSRRDTAVTRPACIVLALWLTTGALSTVGPPASAQEATTATSQALAPDRAEDMREAIRAELATLPEEVAEGSPGARLKAALQRQEVLVDEYVKLLASRESYRERAEQAEGRLAAATAARDQLTARPPQPDQQPPTKERLVALEKALDTDRTALATLRADSASAESRLQAGLEADTAAARERAAEAQKRVPLLEVALKDAADDTARRQAQVELTSAQYEQQVAAAAVETLAAEAAFLRASEPALAVEIEVAEQRVAALEAQFTTVAEALQVELEREQRQAEAALASKERAVERAETPHDKFIAQWEAELARSLASSGEVNATVVPLKKDVAEQEKRLAAEKDELTSLRNLISRSGTTGNAGDRISRTLQQVKRRRGVIGRTLQVGQQRQVAGLRERRFQVEDTLISLAEPFADLRDELAGQLEGSERQAFVTRANEVATEARSTLRDERVVLGEAIALGSQLQNLLAQRLDTLNALERFIRSRAFWLRDGKPVGPSAFAQLPREQLRLRSWLSELTSPQTRARLADALGDTADVIYGLLLFPVLPVFLFWARQRVRAITRRINDRVVSEGKRPMLLVTTMFTGLVSAALLPAYFLLASRLVSAAGLPDNIGGVLTTALNQIGLFLFLWFLSRSFFHRRGIAEVQFGLSRAAANDFYHAVRWLLLGYLVWLTPWQILLAPPFGFESLPRALYLLFLITALLGVRSLVRPTSAFVQSRLAPVTGTWIERNWRGISNLVVGLGVVVILLDLVGYRYASREIGVSCLLSLAILIALPALHHACIVAIRGLDHRRIVPVTEELTGETEADQQAVRGRVERFFKVLFVATGVVSLAAVWGIDQQALQTLDEVHVYTLRGAGDANEFVTGGDLARCVLILVVMFWLLRMIPGVYEYAVFPRLKVDAGVKYALLTITRYGVFVIGVFLALAEIHLDLGRLGWLMAAIGVGLGFGLQEIVSNFVSGLILLIERPVRPGDIVSVGGMTGTVQRINIRATTILNFDRQEVMVPNRSLITSEVTNWTRGDTVNRVVIQIGVAYGSDVDQVFEVLERIARAQPEVLTEPPPSVLFVNHGESSLDFEVRVFVPSPAEMMRVRNNINKQLNRELTELGIEIPFPQRDLHIRSGLESLVKAAQAAQ